MIKRKSILRIIGMLIGIMLIVFAVFLAVTSMLFSFGSSAAPDIFGYNIYIVQDNDFYQLKAGTAAIAQKVWPDEVNSGELIIYNRFENGGAQLAKVNSSTLKEGVMSFDIETQDGENVTISQSQLVARVSYCSDFWGAVIGFAMSPFGVMTIAILPCLAILAFETVKFIFSKRPVPQVETVKLQDETPVYAPAADDDKKNEKAVQRKKTDILPLSDKDKRSLPQLDGTYGKTDEFTEHLRLKHSVAAGADGVKDRADFSAGAKLRMAKDRKTEIPKVEKPPLAKTDGTPSSSAVNAKSAVGKSDSVQSDTSDRKKPGHGIVEKSAAAVTQKAGQSVGSVPDMSLVFKDDDDKRYDIDDILADIEKRHH